MSLKITRLDNVKDFYNVEVVATGQKINKHKQTVYSGMNKPFVSYGRGINTDWIKDGNTAVYCFPETMINPESEFIIDAVNWPMHWTKYLVQSFKGQFFKVNYYNSNNELCSRTVKLVRKGYQKNNPKLLTVFDANKKGIRTIRIDRIVDIKIKNNSFNLKIAS